MKTFNCIRLLQVRLNPAICAFSVEWGKFLGYIVSQRGIEDDPEKLEVIEGMRSSTCHKEVRSLNAWLATLNRFLTKLGDKPLPFFQVLKANLKFEWNLECEKEFQGLKQHLKTLPPLAKPAKGDALSL